MTRHTPLVSFHVFSTTALKSLESFTYFTPDVFSIPRKSLIIKRFRIIVRVSFSAPNASQPCGAFMIVGGIWSMRLGQLAPVSSFRPGLHTAAVYKQTTLYGRFSARCSGITRENKPFCRAVYTNTHFETLFFVHLGSVQIQAPSVGTTITNRCKTI